jgi:hypothetical protein
MLPKGFSALRSYIWVFLGEFVIIFSSITFSWWFDEWRQERNDRKEELKILTNLESNLKQDSLNLSNELSYILKSDYTLSDFLDKLSKDDLKESDSSGYLIRRLIIAPEFHPNSATFEVIKSTGKLDLIDSDSLTQSIMNLYEVNYQELNFLIDVYNKTSTETIWNYAIENHDLVKVFGPPQDRIYKFSFSSDKERKLLINKITFSTLAISFSTFRIYNSLELIESIRKQIRMRIGKLQS